MEYDHSPSVLASNRSISDGSVEKNCRAGWSATLSSPPRSPGPEVYLRAAFVTLRGDGSVAVCYLAV